MAPTYGESVVLTRLVETSKQKNEGETWELFGSM
jgi:hypothetical protein